MIRVLFIRHGATAGNLEKRYIGRTDQPLSLTGVAQIQALSEKGLQAHHLFVSPMLRARQTAALLFPALPATLVEDLRETDFGRFEGKTAQELAGDPAYQAWVDSFCQGPIPGGEPLPAFQARCRSAFLQAVRPLPAGCTAAFVIHGGAIMAILEAYAHPPGSFYQFHIQNGAFLAGEYRAGKIFLTQEGGNNLLYSADT